MKHLGDITKINGAEIPIVDIITGGSPCQDLSCAGLRKGIQHANIGSTETTRSGLFMEQLRIIKEMRQRDKREGRNGVDVRPRYMVWEKRARSILRQQRKRLPSRPHGNRKGRRTDST